MSGNYPKRLRSIIFFIVLTAFVLPLVIVPAAAASEAQASTPQITSITPSLGCKGLAVDHSVTIYGSGFQPGLTASLTLPGAESIPIAVDSVDFEGVTITGRVGIDPSPPGDWNVVVTNPDRGTTALPGAFSILGFTHTVVNPSLTGQVNSMMEFKNQLYVAAGDDLLRSSDGTTWQFVTQNGFGESKNLYSMAVLNDYLYVGDGACQVWRSLDGGSFSKVNNPGFGNANNSSAASMAIFNGYLYVGTSNTLGCQVWRTSNGTSWTSSNGDGFGATANTKVTELKVFKNALYAGTSNSSQGCGVYRTTTGTGWAKVNVSGFGVTTNVSVSALETYGDYIYVGTADSYSLWKNATVCDLYRASDGNTWVRVGSEGFAEETGIPRATKIGDICAVGEFLILTTYGSRLQYYPPVLYVYGEYETYLISKDGLNWVKREPNYKVESQTNYDPPVFKGPVTYFSFGGSVYAGTSRIERIDGLIRPKPPLPCGKGAGSSTLVIGIMLGFLGLGDVLRRRKRNS